MKLTLSRRLQVCCGFISPGEVVADIGCDHGYLGIYLLKAGIASAVIAADVNDKPLQSAVANARAFGVADQMRFYLSDGVRNIPREFDTMVCAGMGADTMISILEAAPWLHDPRYRLVLQCQSRRPQLRRYLSEHHWRITEESVLRDGRFLYTVMAVTPEAGHPLTPGQWYFSPAMLENPGPETAEYYRRVVRGLETAVKGQKAAADPEMLAALDELTHDMHLDFLKEASQ